MHQARSRSARGSSSLHTSTAVKAQCSLRRCGRCAAARGRCELWCTIEESVLPSFAWQQFPKLASKARPQLIARVVVPPTCASVCGDCHGDARSLASVVKHVMSKPSVWCGLKLTADDANETATEMLLREVQQPHRAFCSSKGQRHIFDE